VTGTPSADLDHGALPFADHLKDSGSRDILYLPVELGLERLKRREVKRFGQARPEFLAWAAQYDEGGVPGRSVVVN